MFCLILEANLSKQEELEQLRRDVDSRIEEVTKLAFDNERLHVKYQSYSSNFAPRNIQVCKSLLLHGLEYWYINVAMFLTGNCILIDLLSAFT